MSDYNINDERKRLNCPELEVLQRIPDEHIKGGWHQYATCWGEYGEDGCPNSVSHFMVINAGIDNEDFLDTAYWCEDHARIKSEQNKETK